MRHQPRSTRACIVCDEDATLELKVKTVKYFKGIQKAQEILLGKPMEGTPVAQWAIAQQAHRRLVARAHGHHGAGRVRHQCHPAQRAPPVQRGQMQQRRVPRQRARGHPRL